MSRLIYFIGILLIAFIYSCQQEKFVQGKRIYQSLCQQCHMENGKGLGALYPSIPESIYMSDSLTYLPCLIKKGRTSSQLSTVYMPPQPNLREAEMSNLINYMNYYWGDQKGIKMSDLTDAMSTCD